MIKVKYSKDIIEIRGHADFDNYGNDIVCASTSSIVYTTINGILNIDSEAIKFSDKDNIMKIEIIKDDDITKSLIQNMLELLMELATQYPKNIKISKGE